MSQFTDDQLEAIAEVIEVAEFMFDEAGKEACFWCDVRYNRGNQKPHVAGCVWKKAMDALDTVDKDKA